MQKAPFAILIRIFMPILSLLLTHYSEVLTLYLPEVIGRNNPSLSTVGSRDQLPRNIQKQTRLQAYISSVVLHAQDRQFSLHDCHDIPLCGWVMGQISSPDCRTGRTSVWIQVFLTQKRQIILVIVLCSPK